MKIRWGKVGDEKWIVYRNINRKRSWSKLDTSLTQSLARCTKAPVAEWSESQTRDRRFQVVGSSPSKSTDWRVVEVWSRCLPAQASSSIDCGTNLRNPSSLSSLGK
ncbi:hypothetical protein TNCV_4046961 [Trichonephila clavipes]|nr:hypothetical protein TNCV_4046961 [Trichonephila clavipes]